MYRVKDWAEVKRLHEREGLSKKAIAEKLGMSRNTVARLMCLSEPPAYEREPSSSLLDPFREEILALLAEDPRAPATVIRERLQAGGYAGGITILKDYLAQVRPQFLAARTYQRTTYLPGEIGQIDWWHLPVGIPVGREVTRKAFGLIVTLPHSAAHACFFTHAKTLADFLPALVGCVVRLDGVPQGLVLDNDSAMVTRVPGARSRLHPEAAGLFGALRAKPIDPCSPPPHLQGLGGAGGRLPRELVPAFAPLQRSFRSAGSARPLGARGGLRALPPPGGRSGRGCLPGGESLPGAASFTAAGHRSAS